MSVLSQIPSKTWLTSDQPVLPTNTSSGIHVNAVEHALRQGLLATADTERPGSYEIEIGDNWYYIHIPIRIKGVYLLAAGRKSSEESVA